MQDLPNYGVTPNYVTEKREQEVHPPFREHSHCLHHPHTSRQWLALAGSATKDVRW